MFLAVCYLRLRLFVLSLRADRFRSLSRQNCRKCFPRYSARGSLAFSFSACLISNSAVFFLRVALASIGIRAVLDYLLGFKHSCRKSNVLLSSRKLFFLGLHGIIKPIGLKPDVAERTSLRFGRTRPAIVWILYFFSGSRPLKLNCRLLGTRFLRWRCERAKTFGLEPWLLSWILVFHFFPSSLGIISKVDFRPRSLSPAILFTKRLILFT